MTRTRRKSGEDVWISDSPRACQEGQRVRVRTEWGECVKKLEAQVAIDAKRHLTLGLIHRVSPPTHD